MDNNKKEIAAGVMMVSLFISLVLLLLLIWAPFSHYLHKWSDYWDEKDYKKVDISEITGYPNTFYEAEDDCKERANTLYGTESNISYASSTSNNYQTYDCYGIKYEKIK